MKDGCWLAAAVVVATEAGEKQNPDNPFAAVVVTAVIAAAVAAENAITATIVTAAATEY